MKIKPRGLLILGVMVLSLCVSGCVDQSQGQGAPLSQTQTDTIAPSPKKVPKIAATSMATVYIMEKLGVDLVAVPHSEIDTCPERYKDCPEVGMAMTPDVEILRSLAPDYVFSPVSLISDLLPKYEAAGLNYGFLNLNNVEGMYKSIGDLGVLLHREKEASALIDEYQKTIAAFKKRVEGKDHPKVLILMGLPGSYIVATENSYVGDLVAIAGGENVYAGTDQQFLTINTEDMMKKDPDIILRTAHALPEDVMKMFQKEFSENDTWKHFRAVKEDRVYDLDYKKFGMSAKFNYPSALEDLEELFYEKDR